MTRRAQLHQRKPNKGNGKPGNKQKPNRPKRNRRPKGQRGFFQDLGNMFLPGIGGAIGGAAENLLGPLIGSFLGSKGVAAPTAFAGRFNSNQLNTSLERGREQIATITVPAGTPAGTVLLNQLIAAPDIGVRLSQFSNLWTQTKFRNFALEVVSSNPTSVGGNYTLAIDPDPAQTYSSGADLPGRLMALTTASRANAWADNAVMMKSNPLKLFNRFNLAGASDAEIREYAAGQMIMATTTEYPEDCEYTVHADWDVEFERPDTTQTTGISPGTHVLAATGATATLTGTEALPVVTFNAQQAALVWNKIPAVGIYPASGLSMSFGVNSTAGVMAVQNVTVLTGGTTFTVTGNVLSTGIWQTGAHIVQTQHPKVFTLTNLTGLVRNGLAMVHPLKVCEKHDQWALEAKSRYKRKKLVKAADEELVKRFKQELTFLSDEEVTSLAG